VPAAEVCTSIVGLYSRCSRPRREGGLRAARRGYAIEITCELIDAARTTIAVARALGACLDRTSMGELMRVWCVASGSSDRAAGTPYSGDRGTGDTLNLPRINTSNSCDTSRRNKLTGAFD
jgi:hypothetical protein